MRDADSTARQLQERRERHVGRLLLQAHRAFSTSAVAKLRQRGYDGLTLAHLNVLPHLDVEGTRITALAERGGMTKQGMGQLVRDLERQGYLGRIPDPVDRRATLLRFTTTGRRLLLDALDVTVELETEYAAILGGQRLDDLKSALSVLVDRQHRRD